MPKSTYKKVPKSHTKALKELIAAPVRRKKRVATKKRRVKNG